MEYVILERSEDLAGKVRIILGLQDGSSVMFKFQADPSDDEIRSVYEIYMEQQNTLSEITE